MFNRLIITASIVATAFLSACASNPVTTDYDPNYSLDPGSSFYVLPPRPQEAFVSGLTQSRIESAITNQLNQHMSSAASQEEADVLVTWHVVIEDKIDVRTYDTSYSYFNRGWGMNVGTSTDVRQYKQGTLIVELVDASKEQSFWIGSYDTRLESGDLTPDERTTAINQAVADIFMAFPY